MKLTRIWVIGLVVTLAWLNLAVSQEQPKRPAAPKLPVGVKVLVQCVVDWFGPADLTTMGGSHDKPDSPESRLIGGPVQENKEKARKASPLTYVSKDSAPFLIMHGDQDNTVPLNQSDVLAEALKKAGVEARLVIVEGNGHGGPQFDSPENRRLLEDFFARHLKGPSTAKAEAEAAKKPRVLITISKETTYITEPLRKDGYVNYIAALNQRFRAGVTPENNAAVPFLKAMGPGQIDAKYRDEYFRLLGIPSLPEKGDYFIEVETYAKASKDAGRPVTKEVEEKGHDIYAEQLTPAMKRPWAKKEFPVLAGWLAANEKPLALLTAASKRPRRFDPLIPENGMVMAMLLPAVNQYREASAALTVRAMLHLNEGKVDEAWKDLLACHRLARLAGQGPTLIDALVALGVDWRACGGDQRLLQHARLTPTQIVRIRADLDKLPSLPKIVNTMNVGERFMYLDSVGTVAREGFNSLMDIVGGPKPEGMLKSLLDSAAREAIDWDVVLRVGNTWYNRMADACGKPTRAERQVVLGKIDADLRKLATEAKDWKSLGLSMLYGPRCAISERIGQVFVSLFLPKAPPGSDAEDRGTTQFELTKLGFALAAYHADHGTYSVKLAELVPKYVARVPKDIFNASDLHYRPEGDGYLLYSVGVNGKDDGGKGYDDRKEGEDWDDLAIRVPAATAQKQ